MRKIRAGDYVEVLGGDSGGVVTGEQGLVIDARSQNHLGLIFPARSDYWADDTCGWLVTSKQVKLLYRPGTKV